MNLEYTEYFRIVATEINLEKLLNIFAKSYSITMDNHTREWPVSVKHCIQELLRLFTFFNNIKKV